MSPRKPSKPFDEQWAQEIGQRVRSIIGNESISSFSQRLGIDRSWVHDILGGRVPPSLETLSVMTDKLGFSLDWLRTGRGMPNAEWSEKTSLVPRVVAKSDADGKIDLVKVKDDLVLVQNSLLTGLEREVSELGVLAGQSADVGPMIGHSDEILLDLKDHKLVNNGFFLAQVGTRLLACRAFKAQSIWLLSPTETINPATLMQDYRILGRIRLVWKRV